MKPYLFPAMAHAGQVFPASGPWPQEFCSHQQMWVLTSHFSHFITLPSAFSIYTSQESLVVCV